ncbi:MAG: hypothetical protein U9O87_07765 [Verrucomicrobiota bacterium]|nr:hypothetical protein [Verrucomicrobiota bacterium]
MPRGDGTGPGGQGAGTGRGIGQSGGGRGQMGGPLAAGPGGQCICPSCGYTQAHTPSQPCSQKSCPKCNTKMTRKG